MKRLLLLLLTLISFFVVPTTTSAVEVQAQTAFTSMAVHQIFKVDFVFDTLGENVNVVEGRVIFDADTFSIEEIRDGGTILSFWLERPRVDIKGSEGHIQFSGMIPGGFSGGNAPLFSLVLKTQKEAIGAQIRVEKVTVLRNDGQGGSISVSSHPLILTISQQSPPRLFEDALVDHQPPELFQPLIQQDERMFDGKRFVVFNAQDKESGIERFEVAETQHELTNVTKEEWKIASSPFLLAYPDSNEFVYVRAIDRAGNDTIALAQKRHGPSFRILLFSAIIIFGAFIQFIIFLRMKRRSKKRP